MDKVSTYRAEIKRLLETYASIVARQATRGVETLLALDEADDQFLWLQASWVETCRV